MTLANAVAVLLWVGVTAYAVFGGADFGSGFWDLTAGSATKGARTRALVDVAIGPVWEANHTWLIFCLVVLWTSFPVAFVSVMSTMFTPMALAAVGIVLRGAGFAFRKAAVRFRYRRAFGIGFASSSVVTPLFLGMVAGGIASGRVPVGSASGHQLSSWVNPTSILGGLLAVTACAFLAATFLVDDADRLGESALVAAFTQRAIGAAAACGALALVGIVVIHSDAPYLYEGLTHEALPLVVASGALGIATMVLLRRGNRRAPRITGAAAVASVIWAWGLAQSPYILPESLTIEQAAAPTQTLVAVIVIAAVALAIIVPSLWVLYRLDQMDTLEMAGIDELAAENAPPSV